ncbi:MAG: type I restriction-modification system methyltransferase subunit [Rhodocyclaceae bacterium]|nr:MAG: type I restriction-modification system methyltransferase subunit [Rhodocyclaceae bacterium]
MKQTQARGRAAKSSSPLFGVGRIHATHGALMALGDVEDVMDLVRRHVAGDWGDLSAEERAANDSAVLEQVGRVFSAYDVANQRLCVVTAADRTLTTVRLSTES